MKNKLTYVNNWEADEYYIDETHIKIKSLSKVNIGGKEYAVKTVRISIPYDDMGHTYNGISDHYFVKDPVFGTEIDLNKIIHKRDVYAVEFTV